MSDQGAIYAEYIAKELHAEQERRTKVEDQGKAVIVQSTSLITAVLGVASLAAAWGVMFSTPTKILIGTTVIVFLLAVVSAIAAGWNKRYVATATQTFQGMLANHWTDHPIDARHAVSRLNSRTLSSLRDVNRFKTLWVRAGHVFQLAGMVSAAATVIIQLI